MLARFGSFVPYRLTQRITKFNLKGFCRNQRGAHSYPEDHDFKYMDVKVIPALHDNYMYLVTDKNTKETAVIDPVEASTIMQTVQNHGMNLTKVLTTHHHWDHAGGNEALVRMMPGLEVYGGDERINALTKLVKHGSLLHIGSLQVQCIFTPCHTSGHMCFFIPPTDPSYDPALFSGDTLFMGGCGRFMEGTAEQMYDALINLMSNLPDKTKIFCGHEYTLQNLKFASSIEPKNELISQKLIWCFERRRQMRPTVPSTIGEEKLYNPFMRVKLAPIQSHAQTGDAVQAMNAIRLEKDNFQA